MPERRQKVRHNESAANLYVGLPGQLTVDETNNEIRVHNGSTPGGIATARKDLANVAAATSGNDGKMTSTQAANLDQVISDLDDLEAIVAALSGDNIAFDDTGLNVTAATVQAALAAYDALIVANSDALTAHKADTENPHSVTAEQAGALAIANDLSDLNDVPTALGNLGLTGDDSIWGAGTGVDPKAPSPANVRSAIKSYLNREAGEIVVLGYVDDIPGLLRCDGSAVSRTTHAPLFAKIGTTFGEGDGSTTFNLPNIVKKFMLGADDNDEDFDIASTGGNFEITQTEGQVGHHGHKFRKANTNETSAQSDTNGGFLSSTTSNVNYDAFSGPVSGTNGQQIGENQTEAEVEPMDITNPFIALPVYITTGGV